MSFEPFALADQLTAASRWFQVIRNHMALTQGKMHENSCLKGLRVKRFLASIGVACGCLKSPKVRLEQVDLAKGSRLGTWTFNHVHAHADSETALLVS